MCLRGHGPPTFRGPTLLLLKLPTILSAARGSAGELTIRNTGSRVILGRKPHNTPPRRILLPFQSFVVTLLHDPPRAHAAWTNPDTTLYVYTHAHRHKQPIAGGDWGTWQHDSGLSGHTLSEQPADSDELEPGYLHRFRLWAEVLPQFNTLPGGGYKPSPSIFAELQIEEAPPEQQQLATLTGIYADHSSTVYWTLYWTPQPLQPNEKMAGNYYWRLDEEQNWDGPYNITQLPEAYREYGAYGIQLPPQDMYYWLHLHTTLEGWDDSDSVDYYCHAES